MNSDDNDNELANKLSAARENSRGYAGFFGGPDKSVRECGVVQSFEEALQADNALFFHGLRSCAKPNDPPDCEAVTEDGTRIAIEVTELVDEAAINAYIKTGQALNGSIWTDEKLYDGLVKRISEKDRCFARLQNPPYPGGYVVVIHTDESDLRRNRVETFLQTHRFQKSEHIDRIFLLLSYDPTIQRCPYFELEQA
jgi:hypothetical protein